MIIGRREKFALVTIAIILVCALGLRIRSALTPPTDSLVIGGHKLRVLVAKTNEEMTLGLSYRKDLGGYDGMLFLFNKPGVYGMVMRGMLFPLDMVWINNDRVVLVQKNLPLEPGKAEPELTVYSNTSSPATAVLELPAGSADFLQIKAGDKAEYFDIR
jgi:uncharacterized protein